MRYLFVDGFNSIWHFIFGLLSVECKFILILFIDYQLIKHTPMSSAFAGIAEFFIGYFFLKCIFFNLFSE